MWLATLVVLVALSLGVCFVLVQTCGLRAEWEVARGDPGGRQRRGDSRKAIRSLAIVAAIIAVLGVGYYLGWLRSGMEGGALTVVVMALAGLLLLAAVAVKSAWTTDK